MGEEVDKRGEKKRSKRGCPVRQGRETMNSRKLGKTLGSTTRNHYYRASPEKKNGVPGLAPSAVDRSI